MIRILQTGEGNSRVVCGFVSDNNPDFPASGAATCVSSSLTFSLEPGPYLNAFVVQTARGPAIRFIRKTIGFAVIEAVDITANEKSVVTLGSLPSGASLASKAGSTGLFAAGEGGSGTVAVVGQGPLEYVNFDERGAFVNSRTYSLADPTELSFIFGSGYSLLYTVAGTTYTASFALEDALLPGRSANGLVEQGRPRLGYFYGSRQESAPGSSPLDWSTLADVNKPLPDGYVEAGSTARIDQLQVAAPMTVGLEALPNVLIAMAARAISPEKKHRAVLFSVGGGEALRYLASKTVPKLNGIAIGALPGNYGFGVGAYPLGAGTGVLALPKNAVDDAWSGGACNDGVLLVLPLKRSL